MKNSLQLHIFTFRKIPVFLDWTLIFPLFFFIQMFSSVSEGIVLFLGLYISILLHEFGHGIAAQKLGIYVPKIVLFVFGGGAFIDNSQRRYSSREEFITTIFGPLVTFTIILFLSLFVNLSNNFSNGDIITKLFYINIFLLIFNLIPLFPLDGGRILRSIITKFVNPILGTKIVLFISFLIVFCLFYFSIISFSIYNVLIMGFLLLGGWGELQIMQGRAGRYNQGRYIYDKVEPRKKRVDL